MTDPDHESVKSANFSPMLRAALCATAPGSFPPSADIPTLQPYKRVIKLDDIVQNLTDDMSSESALCARLAWVCPRA